MLLLVLLSNINLDVHRGHIFALISDELKRVDNKTLDEKMAVGETFDNESDVVGFLVVDFLKKGEFHVQYFRRDVADEFLVLFCIPVLEVYYGQGLGLKYVDFVVVKQILQYFLAALVHKPRADLEHKSDQLF